MSALGQMSPAAKPLALNRGARILKRLSVLLIEPTAPTDAPALSKTNTLLLSALLLILIPSILIASSWEWLGTPAMKPVLTALAVVFFGIYVLNRRGRYQVSSLFFIGVLSALPLVALWANHIVDPQRLTVSLIFYLAAILISFLLLRLRRLILVMTLQIAAVVLLPLIYLSVNNLHYLQAALALPLFILCMMAVMLLLAAMMREHSLRQLEQKQIELTESETRFRDLFDATFEAILVHDKGIIVDVNPALERMFGVNVQAVVGQNVLEFLPADVRGDTERRILAGDEEPYEIPLYFNENHQLRAEPTGPEKKVIIEVRGKTHRYRGRMLRVVALRDVTELKKAQASIIDVAVEREKVNILQRFISNMSHDLRTPLTVIKTSVYIIKRVRDDKDKVNKQLETLEAQIDHLQRLMDDLLSMSRLDRANTSEYRFKLVNINAPTAQIVEDHRGMALRRGQTLEFHPAPNLPNALIDENEYKRMIKYLILNGLGYTPPDGTLKLETYAERGDVVIAVRDFGDGINPVDLPSIFDRFYSAERSTGGDGGTGLGLNIARKIAEAHNGTIEAESEMGKGSVFRVRLPIIDSNAPTKASLNS